MGHNTFLRQAARQVVEQGLVTASEVHRYGLSARDVSQSNGVVLVECGNGRGYAVKAMHLNRDEQQGSPDRELALYRAVGSRPELQPLLPALHRVDDELRLIILEGLISSRTLDQAGGGQQPDDPELAGRLGFALGTWHRESRSLTDEFEPADPWMLHLDEDCPLEILRTDEHLRRVVERILEDDATSSIPGTVRNAWQPDTVIHGDIRFSNVMVSRSPPDLRFVDWETSGVGDSAWDVGAAIQEYLSYGIGCGYDMADPQIPVRSAIRSLMEGYHEASNTRMPWTRISPFTACRVLMRAVQLANWKGDPGDGIDRHVELAGVIASGSDDLTVA
jgi:hypothetical protein